MTTPSLRRCWTEPLEEVAKVRKGRWGRRSIFSGSAAVGTVGRPVSDPVRVFPKKITWTGRRMGERGPLPKPYARRRNRRQTSGKSVIVGRPPCRGTSRPRRRPSGGGSSGNWRQPDCSPASTGPSSSATAPPGRTGWSCRGCWSAQASCSKGHAGTSCVTRSGS